MRLVYVIYDLATILSTRMHSSGMRTGRSLTVCWSLHPGGGGSGPGGVWSRGGSSSRGGLLPGGVWSGGCLVPGGGLYPSMHCGRPPPPPVDRHTLVKILLWPNFVAAGKNSFVIRFVAIRIHLINLATLLAHTIQEYLLVT